MGKRYKVINPEEALNTAIKNVEKAESKKINPKYAIVDASAVNVRQRPSIDSVSVDILKKGDRVQLGPTSLVEGFTYIFYGYDYSKAGYMMSKYLKEVE